MRKFLALAAAAVLLTGMVSCGQQGGAQPAPAATAAPAAQTETSAAAESQAETSAAAQDAAASENKGGAGSGKSGNTGKSRKSILKGVLFFMQPAANDPRGGVLLRVDR